MSICDELIKAGSADFKNCKLRQTTLKWIELYSQDTLPASKMEIIELLDFSSLLFKKGNLKTQHQDMSQLLAGASAVVTAIVSDLCTCYPVLVLLLWHSSSSLLSATQSSWCKWCLSAKAPLQGPRLSNQCCHHRVQFSIWCHRPARCRAAWLSPPVSN